VIAEMTYVWTGNDSFIIDHTGVDPSCRGQHIGNEMVKHAVDYARENSVKILPMCPFARSVFDKNPSYSDVRK
jgi:predicted GNAT family acetyltransferase